MSEYLEIILRCLGGFAGVLFIARLVGKSQVSGLNIADWINAIIIGSIAANMVTDLETPIVRYIIALLAFFIITILTEWLSTKYRPAHVLFCDDPTVVVHNGMILENNMRKMRYTADDLTSQLRQKDAFDITDVEYAILEPNGELSVLLKSQASPLTPKDLNIATVYKGIPAELIVDGVIIRQNLEQNNLTEDWLYDELDKHGVHSIQEVYYASLDQDGNLYVDTKADNMSYKQDFTDKSPGKLPQ